MSGHSFLCAGGAVLDRTFQLGRPLIAGTSNPAVSSATGHGGVARNVAENLARLGARVSLVTCLGDDDGATPVLSRLTSLGVGTGGVRVVAGFGTARYLAVLQPDHDLAAGIADMGVLEQIRPADVLWAWPAGPAATVFLDCNVTADVLAAALARAAETGVRLAVDAVSTVKVERLPADLGGVGVLFVNLDEARAWLAHHGRVPASPEPSSLAAALREAGADGVVLTLGADGALAVDGGGTVPVPAVASDVVDVTGAGDALVAGTLLALASGKNLGDAVRTGVRLAALTVAAPGSVRADLTPSSLGEPQ